MDFFEQLEAEVSRAADSIGVEIIIALLDKWEADFERDQKLGILNKDRMLGYYVRLKISLHHLQRYWERHCDWGCDPRGAEIGNRVYNLKQKVRDARRDYYVAKRRIEEEHRDGCDCRGCRCLGRFCPGGQGTAGANEGQA